MTDTLWSDVSEWQCPATDAYPYQLIAFRSNDGTWLDRNFSANYAWARRRHAGGHLWGMIVYYFYRPGADGAGILMARVGRPHPRMVAMIDVESDNGRVRGDQSAQINREHAALARWLGDPRRVIGYGNAGDLDTLWPSKPPGLRLVVAAYDSNPAYPGKFAHQFTSTADTPPFGPSDLNSADGMTAADLQAMFGFTAPAAASKEDDDMYQLVFRDNHASVAFRDGCTHLRLWANNACTGRANLDQHPTVSFSLNASHVDLDITGAKGGVIRLDSGDGDIAAVAW